MIMDEPNAQPKQEQPKDTPNQETPPPGVNIKGDVTSVSGDVVGRDKITNYFGNSPAVEVSPRDREAQDLLEESEALLRTSREICSVVSLEDFRESGGKFFKRLAEFGDIAIETPESPDPGSDFSHWAEFERSKVECAVAKLKKRVP